MPGVILGSRNGKMSKSNILFFLNSPSFFKFHILGSIGINQKISKTFRNRLWKWKEGKQSTVRVITRVTTSNWDFSEEMIFQLITKV